MTTITPVRRLSPRVRRLLDEHDLTARSVPGTGSGGRVVPRDVLVAGGVPQPPAHGAVLASPLARRILRDAGVDLDEASAANDDRPLTRVDAERVVDGSSTGRVETSPPGRLRAGDELDELVVDVAELLAAITMTQPHFVARHGFELDLAVPVAVAAGAALAAGAWSGHDQGDAGARAARVVDVGFHSAGDDATLRTVRDAQDLTVAGLARRSRAAEPVPVGDGEATTITISTDPAPPTDALADKAEIGVLVLGEPVARQTRGTDHLGHEVVHTHPHITLKLHLRDGVGDEEGRALLRTIGGMLAGWTLPVGS